jgi:hypothetical protein
METRNYICLYLDFSNTKTLHLVQGEPLPYSLPGGHTLFRYFKGDFWRYVHTESGLMLASTNDDDVLSLDDIIARIPRHFVDQLQSRLDLKRDEFNALLAEYKEALCSLYP